MARYRKSHDESVAKHAVRLFASLRYLFRKHVVRAETPRQRWRLQQLLFQTVKPSFSRFSDVIRLLNLIFLLFITNLLMFNNSEFIYLFLQSFLTPAVFPLFFHISKFKSEEFHDPHSALTRTPVPVPSLIVISNTLVTALIGRHDDDLMRRETPTG